MVQTIMAVLFFCLLVIMLYPFNQMSLYMADRQFYITDIASKLYRYGSTCYSLCVLPLLGGWLEKRGWGREGAEEREEGRCISLATEAEELVA
jgi:hypothetical protein